MKSPFFLCLLCCLSITAGAQTADSLRQAVSIQYNYQHINRPTGNTWHLTSLEYLRKTRRVNMLARVNRARRFGRTGWQAEGEAYPVLSKRFYSYIGVGYSSHVPVFPNWRGGVSLFANLPKGWEAEGGLRYLYFEKANIIGTAGISKYAGRWLLNLRSFASFTNNLHDPSLFFTARRYFKNENDFAWVQAGSGISPDESRNVQLAGAGSLSSKLLLAGLRKTIHKRGALLVSGGWSRDEWKKEAFGNRWYGTIGLQRHF